MERSGSDVIGVLQRFEKATNARSKHLGATRCAAVCSCAPSEASEKERRATLANRPPHLNLSHPFRKGASEGRDYITHFATPPIFFISAGTHTVSRPLRRGKLIA